MFKLIQRIYIFFIALSKASRSVAETLKSFKFFIVGSKQTDEERDIGLFVQQKSFLHFIFQIRILTFVYG
jgi:hypothetical protein